MLPPLRFAVFAAAASFTLTFSLTYSNRAVSAPVDTVSAAFLSQPPPPPPRPLSPEMSARAPVRLLPDDLPGTVIFRDDSGSTPPAGFTWDRSVGTDADAAPILRVENFNRPKSTDHVDAKWMFRQAVKRGDVLLARFQARAEYARQESGEAMFQLSVQQQKPGFARHVQLALTAGPEWALLEVPFVATRDADPTEGEIHLSFGTIPQAVQIASFEVLNFENRARLSDLPFTRFTYQGRQPGAAWREAALARIQKIRTAPLDIRVIDVAGQPVPDARVEVRLTRPAFIWGTSVDSAFILAEGDDADKYRATLLANFDTAVIENGLKWPKWSGSVASREQALRAFDWLERQGLRQRGHTLVWPGDKFSPQRVQRMPAPRAELPVLIGEHIRDLTTATKGRVYSWDVVNEMMHERDYFKTMPELEAAEWFKIARATDPRAKLLINEYSMLNSARSPDRIALYLGIIQRLRAAGAPIDGLGVQGHVGRQVRNPEDVLADLDLLATAGIDIQVTEFDINTPDEELQADYTRDFLIAFYSHPQTTGLTKWGFWQKKHWKPDAAMFRGDWSEKPNARAWRDLVRGEWLTRVDAATDAEGRLQTRGHLGEYEFNVHAGAKTARQKRTLTADGATITIQIP